MAGDEYGWENTNGPVDLISPFSRSKEKTNIINTDEIQELYKIKDPSSDSRSGIDSHALIMLNDQQLDSRSIDNPDQLWQEARRQVVREAWHSGRGVTIEFTPDGRYFPVPYQPSEDAIFAKYEALVQQHIVEAHRPKQRNYIILGLEEYMEIIVTLM